MGAGPAEAGPSLRAAPELSELELDLTEAPEPPKDWVSERGPFAIVHAEEDDRQVARRLSRHATEAVPRLAAALGVPAGRTMHVYVAPDEETFNAMQPGRVPDWADGTAWPLRGLIYLHTPRERIGTDEPLEQVLDHEIVHVLLGQAFAPRRVPTWLQEGLAQHAARQHTSRHTEAIASGMLGDNLLSLESLSRRFPADPIRARLAYAQSADLVAYIENEHGDEAIRTLVRELATGSAFGAAVRKATGRSALDLDREWRARLKTSPMWLSPLVSDTALFTFAALFFVVGGLRLRRRNRETLARWAREEAIQDALSDRLMQGWTDSEQPQVGIPPSSPWETQTEDPWIH